MCACRRAPALRARSPLSLTPHPPTRTRARTRTRRPLTVDPRTRVGAVVLRNTLHPEALPAAAFVRGESLGCVGFLVLPAGAGGGDTRVVIQSAADPRGNLPSALVNFIARRTPKVWTVRLWNALNVFREERAQGGGAK